MESSVLHKVRSAFVTEFGQDPIVIFSPGRVNFIGEHTDYNKGYVFPAAIDKGIYLSIYRAKGEQSNILALDMDERYSFNMKGLLDEVPTGSWSDYVMGVVVELKKKGLELEPFNAVFSGTIDAGSGLSSSAALENAFVFGLNTIFDLKLTPTEMIFISQAAEHHFVGVRCGIMDQFASMFGKEGAALFLDCKTLESDSHPMHLEGISVLVINTNVKHSLADSAYNERRTSCEQVAAFLNKESLREVTLVELEQHKDQIAHETYRKARYVIEENERVLLFQKAVNERDFEGMGALLYASHEGLKYDYKVSCDELDFLVDFGKDLSYVLGSRMMGGGFGGCTINLINTSQMDQFGAEIIEAYRRAFGKDCTLIHINLSDGTKELK